MDAGQGGPQQGWCGQGGAGDTLPSRRDRQVDLSTLIALMREHVHTHNT